ncbi:MAG: UDP-3-O-(3-hydroxymyristoyl)glucosamine N-acyltransferase [Acidobacteria bacterium]|nr:MAG: UDP-3-O-(3-hydroxymyristoyl)glucosamine N-acyltransferase [Acidobacteriota bacterium]
MKTRDIAAFLNGELHGDGDIEVVSISDIKKAGLGDIAFLGNRDQATLSEASCVIVPRGTGHAHHACEVIVDDPKLAFARIASILHPPKIRPKARHSSAVIADSAKVAENVFIGAFVCVGENSSIGDGTQLRAGAKVGDNVSVGERCIIHPNVFVEDGCTIGNDVILHSGVVIGAEGFGYIADENGEHVKFPQIGTVVIEDNVEIGANSCVDRGALGETRIGAGTKIDNLVQIAHNVQIGKNCIIVALSGISGSSVLEDNVVLAGQVGIADHVVLKSGVVIAAKSAIFPNKIISEGIWGGIPAQPLDKYKESIVSLRSLGRMREEIIALKRTMKSIETNE